MASILYPFYSFVLSRSGTQSWWGGERNWTKEEEMGRDSWQSEGGDEKVGEMGWEDERRDSRFLPLSPFMMKLVVHDSWRAFCSFLVVFYLSSSSSSRARCILYVWWWACTGRPQEFGKASSKAGRRKRLRKSECIWYPLLLLYVVNWDITIYL